MRRSVTRVPGETPDQKVGRPIDVNLWEDDGERAIVSPIDPATVDFDPLSQL